KRSWINYCGSVPDLVAKSTGRNARSPSALAKWLRYPRAACCLSSLSMVQDYGLPAFARPKKGTAMASALDGLTVLDLSTGSAAGLATMFLGDHGARVVRLVATPSAHLRQGGFVVWDRGKACAILDLNLVLDSLGSSGAHQLPIGTPAAEFLR